MSYPLEKGDERFMTPYTKSPSAVAHHRNASVSSSLLLETSLACYYIYIP